MGDNRDDSLDSRFSVEEGGIGFVPVENLIGRATLHLLVDRRHGGLCQAVDLVQRASRQTGSPPDSTVRKDERASRIPARRPRSRAQGPRPVRARADAFERRQGQLRAARVPRRPRDRDRHGALALRAVRERARGQIVAPLQRPRFPRDLRRDRRAAWPSGADPPRQAGPRGWRELERQCRRRRRRVPDGRASDRLRARKGRGVRQEGLGALPGSQGKAPKHPKSALQELAAARNWAAPEYEVSQKSGAHHAPRFTVRVSIKNIGEASAEGSSKQEAETAAATALLEQSQ